ALGRGIGGAAPASRLVPRGVPGDRGSGRGGGARQLAGGEPQRATADLLRPAPPTRGRLPGAAAGLPESPGAGAERATPAAGPDAGGAADRRGARALAGAAGLPVLRSPRLIRAPAEVPPRARLARVRGWSAP